MKEYIFRFRNPKKEKSSCIDAVAELLRLLKVKASKQSIIKGIESHPDYPSLLSITDLLSAWNIDNFPTKINFEDLSEVQLPAIVQFKHNNGHFVVLTRIQDQINYFDPHRGNIIESPESFKQKWTGVVLLVSKNENSGDPDYELNNKAEKFKKLGNISALVILTSIVISSGYFIPALAPLLIFKFVGVFLSSLLLLSSFGIETNLGQAVCGVGKESNCTKVINSNAGKFFGVSLAELALLYFSGGFLTVSFASIFSASSIESILFWGSILALPITFFTITYQWLILKKWCRLCVLTTILLWVESIYLYLSVSDYSIAIESLKLIYLSFSIPFIIWLLLKSSIINAIKIPELEKSLIRFKKSESIFDALMSSKDQIIDFATFPKDIILGNPHANLTITFVTNPGCGHCVIAHKHVESWIKNLGSKLRVVIRFVPALNDADGTRNRVIKKIISLSLHNKNDKMRAALKSWFENLDNPNPNDWFAKFDIPEHELTQEYLNKHSEWCAEMKIHNTPSFFLNGKKFPNEYDLVDIGYFLRIKTDAAQEYSVVDQEIALSNHL
jgi:uncharacterized membrane protein